MDNMERRQNEELLEARRLRRQEQKRRLLMRQRVLVIVLLVIVILSLILILRGCRNRREHPELYVKKDNALELQTEPDATVNIGSLYEPQNLDNTAGAGQGINEAFNGNVYEALFRLTDAGTVEPVLGDLSVRPKTKLSGISSLA